jgi:hypothetical protein
MTEDFKQKLKDLLTNSEETIKNMLENFKNQPIRTGIILGVLVWIIRQFGLLDIFKKPDAR